MLLKYIDNSGNEIDSTEVKFMPKVGESVDLGETGTYKISNIIRHSPDQVADVYLE